MTSFIIHLFELKSGQSTLIPSNHSWVKGMIRARCGKGKVGRLPKQVLEEVENKTKDNNYPSVSN